MPEYTTKLGLPKPLGNETVSRVAHNELIDKIDEKVGTHFENKSNPHGVTAEQVKAVPMPGTDGLLRLGQTVLADDVLPKSATEKFLYVNVSTGNDSTGDGTRAKPYKTIQRAVDVIPNIHMHAYTIACAPGFYPEEVLIKGLLGGNLKIQYDGSAPLAKDAPTGFNVLSILAEDCMCYIQVNDVDFYNSQNVTRNAILRFTRSMYGAVNNCRFDSDTKAGGKSCVLYDASKGNVYSSYFTGQYVCLRAQSGSQVVWSDNNAHGPSKSDFGLSVSSSIVHKVGTINLNATTIELTVSGGHIY
ncbi:hypothetical protein [Bacillus sp. ISL-57]|uniref:hypothetical protein n=1 Tax=Bacillus sp. ISL-57 TaxID=2819135 RepID=UPI001BEC357F|nr:hypothetical protein [Bacillus sp. ISL-57]MBT2714747.1 hypothetical protein [Bacillus sp. ISL-57]